MLKSALKNINNNVSTRLEEKFEEFKIKFEIFKDLKKNEKLGKVEEEGKNIYYKVEISKTYAISRWWYGEGRHQTIKYLNEDFAEFTKFQEELLQNLDVDPMIKYKDLAKEVCKFIKEIIPGLDNLKKTYPETKEMAAKVDTIIKSMLEFKEKVKEIKKKNEKYNLLLKVSDYVVDKHCGPKKNYSKFN
jgi:hypothetical protein